MTRAGADGGRHEKGAGMTRELMITEAFVRLTDTLSDDTDPTVLLHRLVEQSVVLSTADAAGVMLVSARGGLRSMAVSDPQAGLAEMFQLQTSQGPCLDAWKTGQAVRAPDLAARTADWPDFVPLARAAGFAGAYAVPIEVRGQGVGALNLLMRRSVPIPQGELTLLGALARVTAIAVMSWTADPLRPQDILTRAHAALAGKAALDTATGMLAAAGDLPVPEAAAALQRYSEHSGVRPTDTAHALLHRTLAPAAVLDRSAAPRT
ncbi:GAF domain-containing protein [Streptomyces sp. NPDC054838]